MEFFWNEVRRRMFKEDLGGKMYFAGTLEREKWGGPTKLY